MIWPENGITQVSRLSDGMDRVRSRSQAANHSSSTLCAATASMACSASSTSGGWIRGPDDPVQVQEDNEARPAGLACCVDERMVPRETTGNDGGLVDHIRAELMTLETRSRRVRPNQRDRGERPW
jgi:hypothetical protein